MNQGKRQRCIGLLIIFITLFFLIIPLDTHAIGMRGYYLGRRYTLGGSITFSYGRAQTDDFEPDETFIQRYSLGLKGYIVHPRLITFGISTSYSKEDGTTKDNWYLFNSIQLNILPYKPLNFSLRYSRSDSNTGSDYNAYGLTLTYQRAGRYRARGMRAYRMNNNIKAPFFSQIAPRITVLDLDRIEYTDSTTSRASLRLKGRYKRTGYTMGSSYSKDEKGIRGDIDRTRFYLKTSTHINIRHIVSLGGTYGVKNAEDTTTSLFLYGDFSGRNKKNDLFYGLHMEMQKYAEFENAYYISTKATKLRTLPKNLSLSYSAGAHYRSTNGDNYGISGSVSASKPLSNVVTMSAGAGVTVGDTGSFSLNTRFYERPSRRLKLSQHYQLVYRFGSELSERDRGLAHRVGASASMRVHRRLFITTSANYYTRHNTQTLGGSASASTWFWRLGLTSGVGASTTNSNDEEYQNYEAYANLRGSIMRGLYMSVDTRYVYQSFNELRRTIIRPYLYWNWRKISAKLEYEYTTEESNFKDETTTQRVYITITRYFGRVFYR
jgi:hypothetical protein